MLTLSITAPCGVTLLGGMMEWRSGKAEHTEYSAFQNIQYFPCFKIFHIFRGKYFKKGYNIHLLYGYHNKTSDDNCTFPRDQRYKKSVPEKRSYKVIHLWRICFPAFVFVPLGLCRNIAGTLSHTQRRKNGERRSR